MKKKLLLNEFHLNNKAKMVDFAGFSMPVEYTGIQDEHNTVRNNIGFFDISHMGEFIVEGNETENLLSKLTTYNSKKLNNFKAVYTLLMNPEGGIKDDIILYKINFNKYLIIVNASNIKKNYEWFKENNKYDCIVKNVSEDYSLFSVQGPNSEKFLNDYLNLKLELKRFSFDLNINKKIFMIAKTGYTGEKGYELLIENKFAREVCEELYKLGTEKYQMNLCGLGARDTLRLEAGLMLYGQDIDEDTTPSEAKLMWVIKSDSFIGFDNIKRKNKERIFFKMIERGIPRTNYKILNSNNEEIGYVSSGTYSFNEKNGIGIGYIKPDYDSSNIFIDIHRKKKKAQLVKKFLN
jgi:aminomethyltransferase